MRHFMQLIAAFTHCVTSEGGGMPSVRRVLMSFCENNMYQGHPQRFRSMIRRG